LPLARGDEEAGLAHESGDRLAGLSAPKPDQRVQAQLRCDSFVLFAVGSLPDDVEPGPALGFDLRESSKQARETLHGLESPDEDCSQPRSWLWTGAKQR